MASMDLLQRRISGDWYELRGLPLQFFAVRDHMQIDTAALASLMGKLRDSGYDSLATHKRELLAPLFFAIEEGNYRALSTAQIAALARVARDTLFLVMLQRVVVASLKTSAGAEQAPDVAGAVSGVEIGEIIRDVAERVAADAELQRQAPIKAILVKTKEYRRERAKLAELSAAVGMDQQQRLEASFNQSFANIFSAIRKNYAKFVGEAVRSSQSESDRPILERANATLLLPVLTRQADAISKVYSTIAFAVAERYKTRELLSGLEQERVVIELLLEEELAAAAVAAQTNQGGADLLRAVATRVVAGIERHLVGPGAEPEPMVE